MNGIQQYSETENLFYFIFRVVDISVHILFDIVFGRRKIGYHACVVQNRIPDVHAKEFRRMRNRIHDVNAQKFLTHAYRYSWRTRARVPDACVQKVS